MKVTKKLVEFRISLENHIIVLERQLKNILKKGEDKAITCHHTPEDNDPGSYVNNLPYFGGSLEEWLVWKAKLLKVLGG